jgi:hypothetical protein
VPIEASGFQIYVRCDRRPDCQRPPSDWSDATLSVSSDTERGAWARFRRGFVKHKDGTVTCRVRCAFATADTNPEEPCGQIDAAAHLNRRPEEK